jgi:serine/threonine protein kinase
MKGTDSVIGRTLAHYDVVEKIGEGGMGQVYRAVDSKLGRDVALKVLPLDAAAKPDRVSRFEREARSLAALSHPNIVTIYSIEQAEGVSFLTMELVRGRTLDKVTPARGLPLDRFLELGIALADALSSAHRKGITHRDLKPANIMIDDQGRPKILDFGLVKLLEPESPDEMVTRTVARENTLEGRIVGTAAYMSPEQAEGKALDHRSDLFSLGVVLYEMLTGRRPFEGDTQMSTLSAIIREEPQSVTDLRERLPRHLGRIIRRCLQKDVERRYQSALDLRNDLQELRDEIDSGVLEPPVSAPARAGNRWVLPAVGVALIAALAYVAVRLVDTSHGAPELSPAAAAVQVPVTSSGRVTSGSVSPDGNYVTYVTEEGGQSSLHVKQLATGSQVEIVPPGEATIGLPTVTPDGQYVFYLAQPVGSSELELYRIALLGGTPNRVLEGLSGAFAL